MLEKQGYGLRVWSSKGEKSIRSFFEFNRIRPTIKAALEYSSYYNTKLYRDLRPVGSHFFDHTKNPMDIKTLRRHIGFFLNHRHNKKVCMEFLPLGVSFLFMDHNEKDPLKVNLYPEKSGKGDWRVSFSTTPMGSFFSTVTSTRIILTPKGLHILQIIVSENPNLLNIISDDELPRPPIA